jgi:cytochrome b subunit of formate dehydrogenase
MKVGVQRTLGIALIAASAVTAVALYLSGVRLFFADFRSLPDAPHSSLVGHVDLHWVLVVLILVALSGLWLLLFPKHEKPPA